MKARIYRGKDVLKLWVKEFPCGCCGYETTKARASKIKWTCVHAEKPQREVVA